MSFAAEHLNVAKLATLIVRGACVVRGDENGWTSLMNTTIGNISMAHELCRFADGPEICQDPWLDEWYALDQVLAALSDLNRVMWSISASETVQAAQKSALILEICCIEWLTPICDSLSSALPFATQEHLCANWPSKVSTSIAGANPRSSIMYPCFDVERNLLKKQLIERILTLSAFRHPFFSVDS